MKSGPFKFQLLACIVEPYGFCSGLVIYSLEITILLCFSKQTGHSMSRSLASQGLPGSVQTDSGFISHYD